MTWTLYTFGDGDLLANVLRAVAMLANGALGSLTRAAALVGLLAALGMVAMRAIDWPRLAGWFIGFVMIFALLIQIRVAVSVEDVVDGRIPAQIVGDVPLIVALPAAVSSQIGYQLTNLATALQLNGELGGDVLLRPTSNVQALLESALAPGDLHANLVNYLHDCVVREGSGISQVTAANASDLFAAIHSDDFANMMPLIVDGQESPNAISCADMYATVLAPRLAPPVEGQDAGLDATLRGLKCRLLGGRALVTPGGAVPPCGGGALSDAWAALQPALEALHLDNLGTVTPEQVFTTVIVAKSWREAQMDLAREHQDPAGAMAIANDALLKQLEIQSQTGREVAKAGLLRQIRALADGLVILGAPILLALAVTPFVWRALGLYARLFVWLMLWGPIQAIVHYIVLGVAVSDVSGAGVAVTLATLDDVYRRVVQANATGYDAMIAVPGLALALAWGGVGAIGSVLGGAAGGVLAAGADIRRRVEAGEEVTASSYAKSAAIADPLKRPPNMTGLGTADWQTHWDATTVTRGLSGSTVRPGDGRAVTVMRDGSVKIASPTQEVAVTPQGYQSGWRLLDRDVPVSTRDGSYTLPKGALARYTGNGVEVNLPSRTDPLTGRTVTPRGVFAQDPGAPDGVGALTQTRWTVTDRGLTYEAAQGPDGAVMYAVSGRTDLNVAQPQGLVPTAGDVRATVVATPDGRGGYRLSPAQAEVRYLTENGEYRDAQGRLWLPGVVQTGERWLGQLGEAASGTPFAASWTERPRDPFGGYTVFQPYAGTGANVVETARVDSIRIGEVEGTATTTIRTGKDGAQVTQVQATVRNGLRYTFTIPSDAARNPDGTVTVAGDVDGVLRKTRVIGGGLPHGARVDLPVTRAPVTTTIPAERLTNLDPETLAGAIEKARVQPFEVHVPDPNDPTRTTELTVNDLRPFGSPAGATEMRTDGGPRAVLRRETGVPTAFVSEADSSATAPVRISTGRAGWPGFIEAVGKTDVVSTPDGGQQLKAHRVMLYYVSPDGARHPLGYGDVAAGRESTGDWVLQSLTSHRGASMTESDRLESTAVEPVAPGVYGQTRKIVDPATGAVVSAVTEIGVNGENLESVRKLLGDGPVRVQSGGTLRIENDGRVTYEGPAAVTMSLPHPETGRPEAVTASVQAGLRGIRDPRTGRVTFQAGEIKSVLQGDTSTAAMPAWVRDRIEEGLGPGRQGHVEMALSPEGQALEMRTQAGYSGGTRQDSWNASGPLFERRGGAYVIDSTTARNYAQSGDRRLAWDVLDSGLPGTQEQRALEQIGKLTESFRSFYGRQGTSAGASEIGADPDVLKALLSKRLAKVAGKLGYKSAEDLAENVSKTLRLYRISYQSQDQETVNLLAQNALAVYYAADADAAQAAARAPHDPNAYARTFEREYTRGLKEVVDEALGNVREQGPYHFGVTGPPVQAIDSAQRAWGWTLNKAEQMWNSVFPDKPAQPENPDAASSEKPVPSRPGSQPAASSHPSGPDAAASPGAPASPQPGPGAAGDRSSDFPRDMQSYLRDHPAVHAALATSLDQYRRGELPESLFAQQVRSAILAVHRARAAALDVEMPLVERETAAFLDAARQARDTWSRRRSEAPASAPAASDGESDRSSEAPARRPMPKEPNRASEAPASAPASDRPPALEPAPAPESRSSPPSAFGSAEPVAPPAPSGERDAPQAPPETLRSAAGGTDSGPVDALARVRARSDELFGKQEAYAPEVARYRAGEITFDELKERIYRLDPSVAGSRLVIAGVDRPLDFRDYRPR